MKLSSLFKGKVYAFPQTQNQQQDLTFARKVMEKVEPKLEIENIYVGQINDNYDLFNIDGRDKKKYKLKISLDDSDGILKKEASIVKNSRSQTVPSFKSYGNIKIGEKITYLLTIVPAYESVRDYGRSCVINNLELFFENYFDFQCTKAVKPTYKTSLDKFFKNLDPKNYLPQDSLKAFESYTDYPLCREFMSELKEDALKLTKKIHFPYRYKCHGNLSLDNIFYDKKMFYFDGFDSVYMGHPFLDLTDFFLEIGLPEEHQYRFLSLFCKVGELHEEREYFKHLYDIQLRKKLGDLISNYIKEVYIYDSYRYDNILNIADTFSHCYERFCKIEIFNKNRDFIMKTICEPIFGVKA